MIFGDPNSFSVWFDRVESWSTPDFENGCFAFFMSKTLICSQNSTLGVDLHLLSKLPCLEKSIEDDDIFNMPPAEVYSVLYERAFPSVYSDAESSDYTHLVSARSLLDEGHNVFLVESGSKARLIYGMDGKPLSLFDVFIDRGEFQRVIRSASTWRA